LVGWINGLAIQSLWLDRKFEVVMQKLLIILVPESRGGWTLFPELLQEQERAIQYFFGAARIFFLVDRRTLSPITVTPISAGTRAPGH
jgi:hypothetical protein